jgi:hypothetical protein
VICLKQGSHDLLGVIIYLFWPLLRAEAAGVFSPGKLDRLGSVCPDHFVCILTWLNQRYKPFQADQFLKLTGCWPDGFYRVAIPSAGASGVALRPPAP